MSVTRLAYIGQKRTVRGLSGYGLGDAQIDAQNRVTADIGPILTAYDATKNSGQLTATYVQGAMNQIQQLITNYAQQYGSTSRGEAGRVTLQTFVDKNIFPAMRSDYYVLSNQTQPFIIGAPQNTPTSSTPNAGMDSGVNINITSPGTANGATAAMQPSGTPSAPSGIQIPGYETTVNANAPAWYESPYVIAAGIGLLFLMLRKR